MFTWIPIYKEIAEKLLEFRNNRKELIDLLLEMEKDNLKVISLNDKISEDSDETTKIQNIDPFTFFANFNRSTTDENRQALLEKIKEKWQIVNSIPSDFSGLPALTPQNAWFFAYAYQREPDAIDNLWELYKQVMEKNPKDVDANLFNKCLTQRGIKQNITAGVFWIRPNDYFPLVGGVEEYLNNEFGIDEIRIDKLKFTGYLELLDTIKSKTNKPFYEISHESYMNSHDFINEEKPDELIKKFLESDLYKHFREHHLSQKIEREKKAWNLIQSNKGNINKEIIEELIDVVDSHINPAGEKKFGWFGLMLMGNNKNKILHTTSLKLNQWISTLLFSNLDYDEALEKCMNELKIPGAGYGFASLLLYLSNPEKYNVYILNPAINAFKLLFDINLKDYKRSIERYNVFNEKVIELRNKYDLKPQEMDWFINNINHFYNNRYVSDIGGEEKERNKPNSQDMKVGLNTILYGPPGTGKTYKTIEQAIQIIENLSIEELNSKYDSRSNIKKKHQEYFEKGQIKFVTFHQSFSYEDFIEGIKPVVQDEENESGSGNELKYTIEKGVFREIAEDAMKSIDQGEDKKYVLIIDEINRGNIANIFGELITLIEDDKRKGNPEALTAELPYSKKQFSVPNNLYLIGTMNTADRSIEALDTALRRRFTFEQIHPDPKLINPSALVLSLWQKYEYCKNWDDEPFYSKAVKLYEFLGFDSDEFELSEKYYQKMLGKGWNELNLSEEISIGEFDGFRPDLMLEKINRRIEVLLDSDHCIGHAYFMKLSDCDEPFQELKKIFKNKILPLLQEYFYGDLAKIGLILGKDFIKQEKISNVETLFAESEYENKDEYEDTLIVKIKDIDSLTVDSFKKIYEY